MNEPIIIQSDLSKIVNVDNHNHNYNKNKNKNKDLDNENEDLDKSELSTKIKTVESIYYCLASAWALVAPIANLLSPAQDAYTLLYDVT